MMGVLNMTNVDVPQILQMNQNFNTLDVQKNLNQDLALNPKSNHWTS